MDEERKRREFEKSTNKKGTNRDGWGEKTGERKIWGKECSNRMCRELEKASQPGRRSSCRVWPPGARASRGRLQRASSCRGCLKGSMTQARPTATTRGDRLNKGTISPTWRPGVTVVR